MSTKQLSCANTQPLFSRRFYSGGSVARVYYTTCGELGVGATAGSGKTACSHQSRVRSWPCPPGLRASQALPPFLALSRNPAGCNSVDVDKPPGKDPTNVYCHYRCLANWVNVPRRPQTSRRGSPDCCHSDAADRVTCSGSPPPPPPGLLGNRSTVLLPAV